MMLTATRSSLEEMLDSLRRRDEEEKPKDLPPALPSRPASKARLPPARRTLPNSFKVGNENGKGHKRKGSFGNKKMKMDVESPYIVKSEEIIMSEESPQGQVLTSADTTASVAPPPGELEDDNVAYFIKKKLNVWCRQTKGKWGLGRIQSTSGEAASVSLSNGNVMKVSRLEILPANPDILEGVDDLIQLSYLNEPSVLHNLQFRYSQDMIYSKAGPILIALNPFKDVHIYGNDYVAAYRQKLIDSPHVYAMADAAYNEMIRDEVNQSIIISGESGSGKTETAKVAMQYLAALGGGSCGIENEVLQTSFILEAFGNAKTSRNDNSSRFGKLIEIHFSTLGKICGAKIQTFLLEKSRVVQLVNGERSYHIFYQLCAGSSPDLKERLNLRVASEYKYLNHSDCMAIDGVDDAKNFQRLMKALEVVRMSKEDQELVFKMLAAILWLGNMSFNVTDNENHIEVVEDEAVTTAALLMGCSSEELMTALSTRKIQAGKDTIAKTLTLRQAIDTRDALAKFIYANLFDWLVEQVNKSLEVGKRRTGRSISILDIYGFESFQKNSFEQFCINYANERLQQHFNRHLFKLEQEDYELDGVDWTKVDFDDNQECLDLFEKKPLGLLSLLDEESNFPRATDLTLASKLKQHLNANPCFKGEMGRAFSVRHYAGEVMYDTNGFLEKNRDPLPSDSIQLLSSCTCELLQLFSKTLNRCQKQSNSVHAGALDSQKQSVGTKFKGQLFKLMHQMESTTPHFIRCIKPNTKQHPGIFDEDLVLQQLKCCGVLEVVRISRAGYPTRMTHQEFARRYGFLLSEVNTSQDPLSISVSVLQQFNIPPEMYQVGFTKLYLRTGQIGALEDKRKQVLHGTVGIQKCFRGQKARSCYLELKNGVATIQSFVRGEIERRKYGVMVKSSMTISSEKIEEIQAVIVLQSVVRGWLIRRHIRGTDKFKIYPENARPRRKSRTKMPEVKDMSQNQSSALAELQKRVIKAEATVEQKEEENAKLREQLKQFERRWIEYETKMKSMEEMWQKQMASLQMSLAAARKSLASENGSSQPVRYDVASPLCYDSEDNASIGSQTPGPRTPGLSTPMKYSSSLSVGAGRGANGTSIGSRTPGSSTPMKYSSSLSVGAGRGANDTLNSSVSTLMKEFDHRRHTFDDDARTLLEVRPAQFGNTNSIEEYRKLKHRFEAWKKEYKVRLKETKARLHKLGNSEVEKSRRTWWGKLSSIAL